MVDLIVREATRADANAITDISAKAVAELRKTYRPNSSAIAHQQQMAPTLTRLVADLNGQVVGVVDYRISSDSLHFLSLFVHAKYRRQGVATRLVAKLEDIGKKAGAEVLSAYVVKQTGNCAIFESMGFQVTAEEPSELFESDVFRTITEAHLIKPINMNRDEH